MLRARKWLAMAVIAAALSAAPAAAQTTEGWRFFRAGDLAIAPVWPGAFLSNGSIATGTALALSSDIDYHLRESLAVGGLFNMGFREGGFALQFGPQLKYKWRVEDKPHVPYFRGAFSFHVASGSVFGLGLVQLGGGYQYFFHRMIGAGIDVAFTPTLLLHPSTEFELVVSVTIGVVLKL